MRIIAGQRRGHKFDGPKGNRTRPTSDLVRESLFNILGDEVAGLIVVDLFAGTGALGLEALSRGAARAIFVEQNRENVALIHRNLATLRYEDRGRVITMDVFRWARTFEPIDDEPIVVFLDPPYREYENHPRRVIELLDRLVRTLPAGSILAVEASRTLDDQVLPDLAAWDVRRYGGTQIALRTLGPAIGPAPPTESVGESSDVSLERRREFAIEVVRQLRQAGHQALWAGGCVRDLILGHLPSDYDVATDATPEQVMAIFRYRTVPVGVSFGVVRVRSPLGHADEVEVATFRSDGAYVDGRHPESVVFSSPRRDAERRDFTINGMFLDPFTNEVIDYVGGQDDLANRILRAIGDPEARFREDKLRLIRAVRFAARFGMTIESATGTALRALASEIAVVSAERISQELRRILAHESRAEAIDLALSTGLIAAILPPLVPMKGIFQGKPMQPEGDLWDHTLLVLKLLPDNPSFTLAFAALLHDVGKPTTQSVHNGRMSFHHHEQRGRQIADELCRRLKLSNAERERITWLVEYHQYLGEAKRLREAKLKRVLAMPGIEELLALHRADALASFGECGQIDYCEYYLKNQPAGPINPPPLVTGHDLFQHGLSPGPRFKTILEQIREAQLDRIINSKREALEWLDRQLSSQEKPTRET